MTNQLELFEPPTKKRLHKNILRLLDSDNDKGLGIQIAQGCGWSKMECFKLICERSFCYNPKEWANLVERGDRYIFLEFSVDDFCFELNNSHEYGFRVMGKCKAGVLEFGYPLLEWKIAEVADLKMKARIKSQLYKFIKRNHLLLSGMF